MGIVKVLIGLPIFIIIAVFAFVNNDLATFSLWPLSIEVTVSLSVAVIFFVLLGFFLGSFFSWLSHAPLRKDLRKQKKKNKKLSKQHQELAETVSDLQGSLEQAKAEKQALMPEKASWLSLFKKKKPTNNDESWSNE